MHRLSASEHALNWCRHTPPQVGLAACGVWARHFRETAQVTWRPTVPSLSMRLLSLKEFSDSDFEWHIEGVAADRAKDGKRRRPLDS